MKPGDNNGEHRHIVGWSWYKSFRVFGFAFVLASVVAGPPLTLLVHMLTPSVLAAYLVSCTLLAFFAAVFALLWRRRYLRKELARSGRPPEVGERRFW